MSVESITNELVKLGKEIEAAKNNKSMLEGRRHELMLRLKTVLEVDTIEEATQKIEEMKLNLIGMETQITKDFDSLKKAFTW